MTELDGWEDQQRNIIAEWQRKAGAVQAALAAIQVKASSRNGELGITVDAQGHVQHIRLTAQALGLGENRLAQVLLDTIHEAETEAARQATAAVKPLADEAGMAEVAELAKHVAGDDAATTRTKRAMTDEEMDRYYERKSWLERR